MVLVDPCDKLIICFLWAETERPTLGEKEGEGRCIWARDARNNLSTNTQIQKPTVEEEEGCACIPLSINRPIQEYTDIKTHEANLGRAGGRLISSITLSILSLKLTSVHAYYLQL